MITTEQIIYTKDRLMNLERTVAALNVQLRAMPSGRQQSRAGSLAVRFWNLVSAKQANTSISAVCNRPARPNLKVATHDSPRA
jgi:hypothetical protein